MTLEARAELMACPFCGGEAAHGKVTYGERTVAEQQWTQDTFFSVNCIVCGADNCGHRGHITPEKAAAAWNNRLAAAPLGDALDPLEMLLDAARHAEGNWKKGEGVNLAWAKAAREAVKQARLAPLGDVREVKRLLQKISDLAFDEDVGEPLDDAIGYANKALAAIDALVPAGGEGEDWSVRTLEIIAANDGNYDQATAKRALEIIRDGAALAPQNTSGESSDADDLADRLQNSEELTCGCKPSEATPAPARVTEDDGSGDVLPEGWQPPAPADEAAVAWRYHPHGAGPDRWEYLGTRPYFTKGACWTVEPLYTRPAKAVDVEAIARTISLSYGEDPDEMAGILEICTDKNKPLPNWKKYEEQAEAITALLLDSNASSDKGGR